MLDFHPVPVLRSVTSPVLALFGGSDPVIPVTESVAAYAENLAQLPPAVILRAPFDRGEPLRDAVELLAMELDRPGPGTDHLVAALLDVLFIHILRACHDERVLPDSAHSWVTAIRDTGIRSALDAFHDNPGHPWTVAELAQHAVLSRTAFARRFHELIGDPPMTYITWWRMNLAAALLTDTDQSMRAIAQRVGYSSEYAFAHAFGRERGISPGAARRAGRHGSLPDTGKPSGEGDTA